VHVIVVESTHGSTGEYKLRGLQSRKVVVTNVLLY